MNRTRTLLVVSSALALSLFACNDTADLVTSVVDASRTRAQEMRTIRQYGEKVKVGNGFIRTYIVTEQMFGGAPVEIGVAMSEDALEGLPAPMAMSAEEMKKAGHSNMTMYLLDLPKRNPTPYKFVQFDWNAAGHEPAGVYDLPHFDFHFYTVPVEVRNSIVPTDPQYAQKAASYPGADYRAAFYLDAATAAGAPAAAVTIPQMGLHWLDVRSPELQGLTGHPEAFKPFTKTFIYGSWDGQFIFDEPMITRAYILAKRDATDPSVRDELIPVSVPARRSPAGYYPGAYRITYDATAKEYRIALTQLQWRD
jgi:hypothetical protein